MKPILLVLILILVVALLTACFKGIKNNKNEDNSGHTATTKKKEGNNIKKITPKEAYEIIHSDKDFIILDVRTDAEFEEERIEDAILISDYEIKSKAEAVLTDKDALILVYCRSGRRSAGAANQLSKLGYTNIHDFGGILDWPYETIKG